MKKVILIIQFFLVCFLANAQGDPEAPCGPFDPGCNEAPPLDEVPVDGGIGFLLTAGVAWGIKKINEKN